MTHGQSSLDLPSTLFSQTNNTVTIVSVIFSTLGKVLTSTEELKKLNSSHSNSSGWFLNSRLASITVRPRLPDVINPPFKLALETNKVTCCLLLIVKVNFKVTCRCKSINPSNQEGFQWSYKLNPSQ